MKCPSCGSTDIKALPERDAMGRQQLCCANGHPWASASPAARKLARQTVAVGAR